ncbi:hypothetical protein HYFRA_00012155 [Hymenoscyphus fraxineus]|uniref:Uncharacterized protein n=1 Tax=Hymenoscyphus fraxineus TaxID=746836 RepID=A0A9N9L5M3_9HELO|nr:hypothetical protein HYFRA_00012155 [Hymenoscyphus fraxineus]
MSDQRKSLKVPGFPSSLSFGGYAGTDGAGDLYTHLSSDESTKRTVQLAAEVEAKVGKSVLPILVAYTTNLSLGDPCIRLQNETEIQHGFSNLILSLQIAVKTAKEKGGREVPAAYIMNPEFLGTCQQQNLSPDFAMPVRGALRGALEYRAVKGDIPEDITNTLKGYVSAVNWVIRLVARDITFGWQANIWGVGNATWIYDQSKTEADLREIANQTVDYIKSLGVYTGAYAPDFLAIDRYEADDLTIRGYGNGYCYSPSEWERFYDFCSNLNSGVDVPVMPWQIPASRLPYKTEAVADLEEEKWGTGGTYLFGDERIGKDLQNVNPEILGLEPAGMMGMKDVKTLLGKKQTFDLSRPAYEGLAQKGIFAVLLGGGATTGIASTIGQTGGWTQEKLAGYERNPVTLT